MLVVGGLTREILDTIKTGLRFFNRETKNRGSAGIVRSFWGKERWSLSHGMTSHEVEDKQEEEKGKP